MIPNCLINRNNESGIHGMSLLNRSKIVQPKDSSGVLNTKRMQTLVRNASDLSSNVGLLKSNDSMSSYTQK
jgi:hypothetical protein